MLNKILSNSKKKTLKEGSYDDFLDNHTQELNQAVRQISDLNKKYDVLTNGKNDDVFDKIEKALKNYDKNVFQQINHWISYGRVSTREILNFAFENENRFGTEMQNVLYAIDDFYNTVFTRSKLQEAKKRELSPKQKAFRQFFFDLMDEHEVDSPSQLDEKGKIEFFNKVKKGWKKHKKEHFNESYLDAVNDCIAFNKEVNKLMESYLKETSEDIFIKGMQVRLKPSLEKELTSIYNSSKGMSGASKDYFKKIFIVQGYNGGNLSVKEKGGNATPSFNHSRWEIVK